MDNNNIKIFLKEKGLP